MTKDELIDGEIYKHSGGTLLMWGKGDSYCNITTYNKRTKRARLYEHAGSYSDRDGYTKATSEEEQWLKACIKAGKFIPFSEIKLETDNYAIY